MRFKTWLLRYRIVVMLILLAFCYVLLYRDGAFLILYSNVYGWLVDHRYITRCHIRKHPIVFIANNTHVRVVWETNCIFEENKASVTCGHHTLTLHPHILDIDATHRLYEIMIPLLSLPITDLFPHLPHHQVHLLHVDHPKTPNPVEFRCSFQSPMQQDTTTTTTTTTATTIYRLLFVSDNQNGDYKFMKILRQAVSYHCDHGMIPPTYDYLFHLGDAVQLPFHYREWQSFFFDPLHYSGLAPSTPIVFVPGNHDVYRHVHQNPYTGIRPSWFLFHVGPTVEFFILDSNVFPVENLRKAQMAWFLDTLLRSSSHVAAKPDAPPRAMLRVVCVHMGPFVEYWSCDAWRDGVRNEYLTSEHTRTFLDEAKREYEVRTHGKRFPVDLIISGHQHNYQRGEREGIVYAIIGGAGGELDLERVENWHMYSVTRFQHHFVQMTLRDTSLYWEAVDEDGTLMDSFVLHPKAPQRIE